MKNKFLTLCGLFVFALAFMGCQPESTAITVTSIEVKTQPTKTTYIVEETFDATGLTITAHYSDNTTKDIEYSATSGITLSTPDMNSKGEKTVTVTFSKKKTTFNITVISSEAVVYGSKTNQYNFVTIPLGDYNGQTVAVDFSTKMLVENKNTAKQNLMWQIYDGDNYLTIASKSFETGTSDWETVAGTSDDIKIESAEAYFYLNANGLDYTDLTIYLDAFTLKITAEDNASVTFKVSDLEANDGVLTIVSKNSNWLSDSVPSIKETYADQFDSIGIAAEYGNFGIKAATTDKYGEYIADGYWGTPNELYYEEVQNGIAKHANSITLGNELKPQFLLQWWSGSIGESETLVSFTASNGQTIKVPSKLNGESLIYATLNVCKKMNVQMRGHVLTWHSQTPDGFFAENYTPTYNGDLISNMVSKEVMTARHEWYIKTVLKCVADWETANNYRAIWAWDVVNEAMADDAGKTYTGTSQNWLRGSTNGTKDKSPDNGGGSRWYQVYGNEEFIVNAFRFANAYAPEDVKLCYNDYNEYWDAEGHYKTSAIEHIATLIKAGDAQTINGNSVAPRFDVIAMQSHVGTSWPGVTGYETALKRFLALADVHVSEIDFSAETQAAGTQAWADYFKMLQKYGKKSSETHKITNVTIWGINNENSWINPSSKGGKKTYPLLFNLVNNVDTNKKEVTYDTGTETLPMYDVGDTYKPNDAFWAVINAHAN